MRRSFLDNLLFAVVVLIAFGASSYFWFNFFVRGKSIPTPNLIGKSTNDARAICSDLGIVLLVDPGAARHADRVPAGAVVWQNRTAGPANFVKRGTKLRIGVSLGPLILHVPDLAATSPRTALLRLGQQGLRLGNLAYADDSAIHGVLAEDPPVGTVVAAQTQVSLLVGVAASGRVFVMPDLIDLPLAEVRPALEGKGLAVSNVRFEAYPGIADGIIIRQYPLRGAPVSARDAITVVVSKREETSIIEQPAQPIPQPQPLSQP
jgi:beta-lactam-binding protein with PASTA domain